MREITQEIKEKIFALYWGQDVFFHPEEWLTTMRSIVEGLQDGTFEGDMSKCHLILKSLSSISDEDAIECCLMNWEVNHSTIKIQKIKRYDKEIIIDFAFIHEDSRLNLEDGYHYTETGMGFTEKGLTLKQTDFLRSKGYALPAYDFSVDELVSSGIFKLQA